MTSEQHSLWAKASIGLLLLLSLACSERALAPSDVAGKWTLAAESQGTATGGSATLLLDPQGTFEAVNLPGDMLYFDSPAERAFVSGSGKWKVADGELKLDFTQMRGGEGRVPYRTNLFVDGRGADTSLYYHRGDPDEGNRIYFKRT